MRGHVELSLDRLSQYEKVPNGLTTETATEKAKITDDGISSDQFDIAPETLRRIRARLVNMTGELLRREFITLSLETGIPCSVLEAIHGQAVEIVLKVEHPHPRDRYGNAVRVHPEIMAQLGLQKIDRARIIAGEKEHIVTVQPLDANEDMKVIKMNKMVRDMIGVEVGDTVELRRVSSWGRL